MRSRLVHAWPLALVMVVAGCSTTTGGASEGPSAAAPTSVAVASLRATIAPTASPTPAPAASESTEPSTAVAGGSPPPPPDIDPCTLLTADEASKVSGTQLGAGVSTTLDPNRVCTFRKGQAEVKLILAPKAPSADVAKAYWDQERAQVPAEVPVHDLTLFDRSAYGSASGGGLSISAIFVIDGDYFFDLFCMPSCSEKASVGAAQHIAGRLH